jgi:hypothetical protein
MLLSHADVTGHANFILVMFKLKLDVIRRRAGGYETHSLFNFDAGIVDRRGVAGLHDGEPPGHVRTS